nr:MAG TPA: hypothetical protein [Caudoviricetes sp.]
MYQTRYYSIFILPHLHLLVPITKKAVTLDLSRITAFFLVKLATGIGPVTSALPMLFFIS